MIKYLIEILIATAALVASIALQLSWYAVAAGVSGIFLGFGLFRYMLAGRLYKTMLENTMMKRG